MAGKNGLDERVKALEATVEKLVGRLHEHGIHVPEEEKEKPADGWPE